MAGHQELRHDQAEHGVAQELEPLVALGRRAVLVGARGMRERLREPLGTRERVPQALAQRGELRVTWPRQ
jgi:hypothetical protein